jgi:hypothetical protein
MRRRRELIPSCRLSRPSLSVQQPLPTYYPSPSISRAVYPSKTASLSYPSNKNDAFILSPLLTLPPAFGSAYVGETFSCTLCANNEVLSGSLPQKTISNVRIEAEMKIPSSKIPIPLVLGPEAVHAEPPSPTEEGHHQDLGVDLEPGRSLQRIVDFELKEEGSHVLAVTVTYHESTPTSGKVRTFRKLYQFVSKSCMIVRTKTSDLPPRRQPKGRLLGRQWVLEAQLENCGEEIINLDTVEVITRVGYRPTSLNWEVTGEGEEIERPVLMPGDVQQVCFVIEELLGPGETEHAFDMKIIDGRLIFGVLTMCWRGPMGNIGNLSTGNIGARIM